MLMDDGLPSVDTALSSLLSRRLDIPAEEPQIAQAIAVQGSHMELRLLPLEIRCRIRDAISRFNPNVLVEVGSGIGVLSAWMLDHFHSTPESAPDAYYLVEGGPKFAVILTRLLQRYQTPKWSHILVGRFESIIAESRAAHAVGSADLGTLLPKEVDAVIVDVGLSSLADCVRSGLDLLAPGGLLLCAEPETPTDVTPADDPSIGDFQRWMDLVRDEHERRPVAFVPLEGGTLVAMIGTSP